MIVVDTSVWVEAFRDGAGNAAAALRDLIDDGQVALAVPVKMELLLGAPQRQEAQLRRVLSALPCWYTSRDLWRVVEAWIEPATRAGQRFGVVDLLIAAVAQQHRARVWSLDRDFRRFAALGFVDLYRP